MEENDEENKMKIKNSGQKEHEEMEEEEKRKRGRRNRNDDAETRKAMSTAEEVSEIRLEIQMLSQDNRTREENG